MIDEMDIHLLDGGVPDEFEKQADEASESELNDLLCGWHGGVTFFGSDTNYYDTDCGHSFVVNEGSPSDNNMNYCCYCGKKIQESI